MSGQALPRRKQMLLFAKNFIKHPKMLGSLIPSSGYLIRQLLDQVDWQRAELIIEYGPGVGSFTSEILARLGPQATLMVIETNADFVDFLRAEIDDPRLRVVHGSAAEVDRHLRELGLGQADYIISGIPFSTMPEQLREEILLSTRDALKPDGAFLVYQFSAAVGDHLQRIFGAVEHDRELRNLMPAHCFYCRPTPVSSPQARPGSARPRRH